MKMGLVRAAGGFDKHVWRTESFNASVLEPDSPSVALGSKTQFLCPQNGDPKSCFDPLYWDPQ